MTFRKFRDKAAWVALAGGVLIFAGQWASHLDYVDRVIWVDRTPPTLNLLGFWLTVGTAVFGLLTLPRWQSFLALAACGWVTLISWQGI